MQNAADEQPASARATTAALRRDTVLRAAEGATAKVQGGGVVEVAIAGRRLQGRAELLAVLEAFAAGCTLDVGLAKLAGRAAGSREFMGITAAVMALEGIGALVRPEPTATRLGRGKDGFDDPRLHIGMLDDRVRTECFIAATRATVRPGDVVLDIGTGTGVLAVAAAKAGARKVYAIDIGNVAAAARAVVEANGVGDRVEVIQDWSARVELSERADVLVAEVVGHDPFGENILETFLDARRRLLTPDARLVPGRIRVFGRLAHVSDERIASLRFDEVATRRWTSWYGIDFAPLPAFNAPATMFYLAASQADSLEYLGEPALLAEVDLRTFEGTSVRSSGSARATVSGTFNAVVVTFELQLSPGIACSSAPGDAGDGAHWLLPVWLFAPSLAVEAGDAVELEYACNDAAARDGVHVGRCTRAQR